MVANDPLDLLFPRIGRIPYTPTNVEEKASNPVTMIPA